MPSVILPNYIKDDVTLNRVLKWLDYMDTHIKHRLEYDRIILLDNASDLEWLKKLNATVHNEKNECLNVGRNDLFVYRYEQHYPRTGHLQYPYYWRAVYQLPKFNGTFYDSDKYYWIDSDVYIVKEEFIDHIKGQNSGLIRYMDRNFSWGESILMTINRDSFKLLSDHEIANGGWLNRNDCAEITLPKTEIDGKFNGGRFPEGNKPQDDTMYWIGQVDQAHPNYEVKWNG